jgi:transcriptional regulator with PAS, ATPase and Fis domain
MTVRRAVENASMRRRLSDHVSEEKARFGLENIVGESRAMTGIKALIRRIARSETTTVLLLGESGTGKDMMARAVHYESNRVDRPFVNITCTALPETLLESELFGYEKGAFTDARVQKKGLFEVATGGTVFLDEIADMRPSLQSKLLRVLEEKAFKRIGGTDDVTVDVRVIAATNRDIDDAMRTGRFREDLYYRLSTVPIQIPPLRERSDDIPLLATHFLRQYNHEFHQSYRDFTPDAMRKLLSYAWPGNVRELRNVIERAALLGTGETILADDIVLGRSTLRRPAQETEHLAILPDQGCKLEDVERDLVCQALDRTRGNRTQAAELLGLTRDQIRYKIEKYQLPL